MKKITFLLCFFIFFMVFSQDVVIQNDGIGQYSVVTSGLGVTSNPGNPNVDAGADVVINCGQTCIEISASFLEIGETNTYSVTAIPFDPPFPFNGLTNSLNPDIDDSWSAVEALPFDFCFFNNIETEFQIGSNGVIRFDVDPTDVGSDSNAYKFSQNIPNNAMEALSEANIFTPGHDLAPHKSNSEEIAWEIIGTAPNRVLAVSFYNVPMFGCEYLFATQMAVFYETTNVIEIYIENSPTCSTNNSSAVVGIQNNAGTKAFVPPGRNTDSSPWTATNEAWRFTPAGSSIVDFKWLDEDGNVVGTTPMLTVCPTQETTYTAQVIYTSCNGDTVIVADKVTVDVKNNVSPIFNLEESYTLCIDTNGTGIIGLPVLDTRLSVINHSFAWYYDGILIAEDNGASLTASKSGRYSVDVTNNTTGCSNTDSAIVVESEPPTVDARVTTAPFSGVHAIDVVATGHGAYEYSLDGGPWQESTIFTDISPGTHTIIARDINGCGFARTSVVVVDYPRYFTPNGDGYNDTWNIVGMQDQPNSRIYIFDRYGKLLKQISTSGLGWDGTFIGEPMPISDYWFILEYSDSASGEQREFKGHFTLKR